MNSYLFDSKSHKNSRQNVRQNARQRVAEKVRRLIRARRIGPDGILPNYYELCTELDTSYASVNQGMSILEAEGIVRRVRGKGTFVTKDLTMTPHPLTRLGVISVSSSRTFFAHSYLTEIMHGAMSEVWVPLNIFSASEIGLINAAHLAEQKIDGVLLLGVENDDYLRAFAQWGTPGVAVDYCPRSASLDHVACDNHAAARRVVAHLAALGHRRVAYAAMPVRRPVSGPLDTVLMVNESSDERERQEASLSALQEQGIHVTVFAPPENVTDSDVQSHVALIANRLAEQVDRPTALLTADANFAAKLPVAIQHRGLRIPQDIAVCAVAGDRDASYRQPVITHCRFDFVAMGRKASQLLLARCLQPEGKPSGPHRIGFEFVQGQTTGPA